MAKRYIVTEIDDGDSDSGCWLLVLIVLAVLVALYFVLMPGILLTMLMDSWIGIDSRFWLWFWSITFTLAVLLCCKFDLAKYAILDAITVTAVLIVSWIVDAFCPWSFFAYQMFSFNPN